VICWLLLVPFFAQLQSSVSPSPITVAEAINDSARYDNKEVTITGFLSVSEEWTRLKGTGCVERVNAMNRPFVCAASLNLPDCSRNEKGCSPGLLEVVSEIRRLRFSSLDGSKPISLTGKLSAAPLVWVPYFPSADLPGLPSGQYRPMGFGHMNGSPVKLLVTDGRVLTNDSPEKSPNVKRK